MNQIDALVLAAPYIHQILRGEAIVAVADKKATRLLNISQVVM